MTRHMGQAIHSLANEVGLKAEDIAPALGCTTGTVYRMFRLSHVDSDTLFALSALFNKPMAAFFGESYVEVSQISSNREPIDEKTRLEYEHKIEKLELQLQHKDQLLEVYKSIPLLTRN